MADPNFFKKAGPYTLTQLAEMVGAKLVRCLDPDRIISDVATRVRVLRSISTTSTVPSLALR